MTPKGIRDQLGLHSGDEVDFEVQGDHVVLVAADRPAGLGGRSGGSGMAARLLAERPVVSWVNLVEVYYHLERDHGREQADTTIAALRAEPRPTSRAPRG